MRVSDALSLIKGPVVLIGNSIGGGLCRRRRESSRQSSWINLVQHGGQLVRCGQVKEEGALDVAARTLNLDLAPYAGPPQFPLDAFGGL